VVKIFYKKKKKELIKIRIYFYQGQRLHQTPNKELEKFGIFNGNYIMLIGEKVCLKKKFF